MSTLKSDPSIVSAPPTTILVEVSMTVRPLPALVLALALSSGCAGALEFLGARGNAIVDAALECVAFAAEPDPSSAARCFGQAASVAVDAASEASTGEKVIECARSRRRLDELGDSTPESYAERERLRRLVCELDPGCGG